MSEKYRRLLGFWLRRVADRVDWYGAPKRMSWTFTFEDGVGIVFQLDGPGCPLWYYGNADFERAHRSSRTQT
jgi:hypothetical protein